MMYEFVHLCPPQNCKEYLVYSGYNICKSHSTQLGSRNRHGKRIFPTGVCMKDPEPPHKMGGASSRKRRYGGRGGADFVPGQNTCEKERHGNTCPHYTRRPSDNTGTRPVLSKGRALRFLLRCCRQGRRAAGRTGDGTEPCAKKSAGTGTHSGRNVHGGGPDRSDRRRPS